MIKNKLDVICFFFIYVLFGFILLSLMFCLGQYLVDIVNFYYLNSDFGKFIEFNYLNVRELFPIYFSMISQIAVLSILLNKIYLKTNNKLLLKMLQNPKMFLWIFLILVIVEVFVYLKNISALNFEKYYLIFGFDRFLIPFILLGIKKQIKFLQFKSFYCLHNIIDKDLFKFFLGYGFVNLIPMILFVLYLKIMSIDVKNFDLLEVFLIGLLLMMVFQIVGLVLYSIFVFKKNQNLYFQKIFNSGFVVFKIWILLLIFDFVIYNLSGNISNQILNSVIIFFVLWGGGRFIFPLMIINLFNMLRKKFY